MPRLAPTREPQTDSEQQLVHLEREVARGQVALHKRNWLVRQLVAEGASHADLARLLNHARDEYGVSHLTPDAIGAAVKRGTRQAE